MILFLPSSRWRGEGRHTPLPRSSSCSSLVVPFSYSIGCLMSWGAWASSFQLGSSWIQIFHQLDTTISDVCAMLVCIIRGLIVAHCSLTTYYYPLLVLAIRRPCNYSSQSSSTALDPPLDLLVRRGYHQNLAYTSWWSTYIIGSESEIELSTQTRGNELIWT